MTSILSFNFYINKIAQTVAICGAMFHAKIHTIQGTKTRIFWWTFLSVVWCSTVFLSTIPVLSTSTWKDVSDVITNPALAVLYSVAAGTVLWAQQYFRYMKLYKIDRKDTYVGLGVFTLAAGQSAVTALFL